MIIAENDGLEVIAWCKVSDDLQNKELTEHDFDMDSSLRKSIPNIIGIFISRNSEEAAKRI